MAAIEIKVDASIELANSDKPPPSNVVCHGCGPGKDPHGPDCPARVDVRLLGDAERTASGGGVFLGDTRRVSGVEVAARQPDGRGKFVG